jgi:G3E family GTPase
MKAIVNLQGRDKPTVLHAVQHVFYPPAELAAWPEGDDRRSRFVFITDGLDEAFVQKLMQDFTQAAEAGTLTDNSETTV